MATLVGDCPETNWIKGDIARQLTVQVAPMKILSSLRIPDLTTGVEWDERGDPQILNPMIKKRDVYNFKAEARREALGPFDPHSSSDSGV